MARTVVIQIDHVQMIALRNMVDDNDADMVVNAAIGRLATWGLAGDMNADSTARVKDSRAVIWCTPGFPGGSALELGAQIGDFVLMAIWSERDHAFSFHS